MKKIFVSLALIALICLSPGLSFGAESEYVRKDVFEAYMQSINTKFDRVLSEISGMKTEMANLRSELKAEIADIKTELKAQKAELTDFRKDLNSLTQTVAVLAEHVRGLDNQFANTRNNIYLGLVFLGVVLSFPTVNNYLNRRYEKKQAVTLEDVKRLIDEAKLGSKSSV